MKLIRKQLQNQFIKRLNAKFIIIFFIVINLFIFFTIILGLIFLPQTKNVNIPVDNEKQLVKLIKTTTNERLKISYYKNLLSKAGPVRGQDLLYKSGIAFDGNAHLLNHTSGEWIYDKYKEEGIIHCRDYFLSSCYHGFLIKVIDKNGIKNLKEVMDTCWEIGTSTAAQCAHAIGHGLVAWNGYADLPKSLKDCDTMIDISPKFPEYHCYDGVFMENNWGLHENGLASTDRWFRPSDPTYPCYESRIDEKYRKACWSNQPQMAYKDIFEGDIKKTSLLCQNVINVEYQKTCFDSLARQLHPLTKGSNEKVYELCGLMPDGWEDNCIISLANSYFSLGDRQNPFQLCAMGPNILKIECFRMLEDRILIYEPDKKMQQLLCQKIIREYVGVICSSLLSEKV